MTNATKIMAGALTDIITSHKETGLTQDQKETVAMTLGCVMRQLTDDPADIISNGMTIVNMLTKYL